jgi:hypothetical protein
MKTQWKAQLIFLAWVAIGVGAGIASSYGANGNTLRWVAPTTREDGTAFNMATEGAHYQVTVVKGSTTTAVTAAATATSLDITSYDAGTTFTITACDKDGLCSVSSNSVKKSGKPSKPTGVDIE